MVAIALGILLGSLLPTWATRIFVTFNDIFGQFLSFSIPLIIVGLITPAIGELGRGAGKWLALTAGLAYASTLIAGLMGLGASLLVLPAETGALSNPEDALLKPYFSIQIPPLFGVMTALVLAFVIGVALATIEGKALRTGFEEFRDIVNLVISKIIIPLLPIYIFGIFLNMTQGGQVLTVIATFLGVVVFVFILTWIMLLLQYLVAGAIARRNPLRMLGTMLPAYLTALGTSSSAATIPVTLRQSIKSGTSEPVASFAIPLCATIHLAGSTIKITCFSLAVMMLSDIPIDPVLMIGFICMLGVMMVAAPGVPGGAIVTAAGLLQSMLGFNEAKLA